MKLALNGFFAFVGLLLMVFWWQPNFTQLMGLTAAAGVLSIVLLRWFPSLASLPSAGAFGADTPLVFLMTEPAWILASLIVLVGLGACTYGLCQPRLARWG